MGPLWFAMETQSQSLTAYQVLSISELSLGIRTQLYHPSLPSSLPLFFLHLGEMRGTTVLFFNPSVLNASSLGSMHNAKMTHQF